ncbi:unnamed protein product [Albugo candida]|uniref:Uncharacterized protein n=1 Tax=Albugo candida TaxID=65357 RepID=A0A024FSY6_9STRA|nr:unnamed protein product [Albugo candida]|eukprot:CCI10168.1 unnamed protein product [Albugo candida]
MCLAIIDKAIQEAGNTLRTISRMVQVKFVSLSARTSITREWTMNAECKEEYRSAFRVIAKSLAALSTYYGAKSQIPGVINNTT